MTISPKWKDSISLFYIVNVVPFSITFHKGIIFSLPDLGIFLIVRRNDNYFYFFSRVKRNVLKMKFSLTPNGRLRAKCLHNQTKQD